MDEETVNGTANMIRGFSVSEVRSPDSGKLLHLVAKKDQSPHEVEGFVRVDLSEPEEFLQIAVMEIPKKMSFRPHIHLERERRIPNLRAQESWVILSGRVSAELYDDTGVLIEIVELGPGDFSLTFRGGHSYKSLEADTQVIEFKTGPYEGRDIDKKFI